MACAECYSEDSNLCTYCLFFSDEDKGKIVSKMPLAAVLAHEDTSGTSSDAKDVSRGKLRKERQRFARKKDHAYI